ncbi:MAG TPA: peptide chain release factor N(5)-glutamine methyltransferase [Acidobacteriaceae bacterium]|nr:peptide chain release factor N(5)-glutamine methyltransferase [Acidobacteriaceae bacterium]
MFAESMTIGDAIVWGTSLLEESDLIPAARSRSDSILLLRHVLGVAHAEMYAYRERPLTALQTEAFNAMIQQRLRGTPVQYITGEQEFFGLPFRVTPDVLIPRPETEHLVEAAIARLKDLASERIVDVGTGSGAIAVALAHALPQAEVTALDISPAALAVAAENAKHNGVAARVRFFESDLLSAVAEERFDAIVSNPPYVASSERKSLPVEVRDFEPTQALFAGPTGLEMYRRIIPDARPLLVPGGWLMMEIGQGQRDPVRALLQDATWAGVEFLPDLQGIPRVAVARKH